jgi:hypothetical protein
MITRGVMRWQSGRCFVVSTENLPKKSGHATGNLKMQVYPRARFAKDVILLTNWPKDTHRQGLGVDY